VARIIFNKKGLGFTFGLFSAIAWGTNSTFCALLTKLGLSSGNIAVLGPGFNLIFFFCVLLISNRTGFLVRRKMLFLLIVNGILAGIVNISFIKSISYFPIGVVSTLVFCNIFVIMIMSRLIFKTKITWRKIAASILAVFGVGLVLNIFEQGLVFNPGGIIWIIFTILAWSSMITIEKYLLEKEVDSLAILMYTSFFAVLSLSIISSPWNLIVSIANTSSQTGGWVFMLILGYGLIPQIGCYYLYISGLKFIEPSYIQIAYSLDPVTASMLGFIVFGQTMKITQMVGVLLILVVVGYIQLKENYERETFEIEAKACR
jgi:drug/metabolite transporter (DMT)-like permease